MPSVVISRHTGSKPMNDVLKALKAEADDLNIPRDHYYEAAFGLGAFANVSFDAKEYAIGKVAMAVELVRSE